MLSSQWQIYAFIEIYFKSSLPNIFLSYFVFPLSTVLRSISERCRKIIISLRAHCLHIVNVFFFVKIETITVRRGSERERERESNVARMKRKENKWFLRRMLKFSSKSVKCRNMNKSMGDYVVDLDAMSLQTVVGAKAKAEDEEIVLMERVCNKKRKYYEHAFLPFDRIAC